MNSKPPRVALKPKDRAKIFFGSLLHPKQSRRWLEFVEQSDILHDKLVQFPFAHSKIYRPYLSTRLDCAQRVDILITHYRFLSAFGLSDWVRQASQQPVQLCELSCKSGAVAALELSALHEGHREGELCLRLIYKGEYIFAASLVIFEQDGKPCLMVGRLQGKATEQARELVREATRDLYSTRPAGLLILAARHFAYLLGCQPVLLVSNRNRISINLWRRWHITSNYDQTWTEMEATPRPDGNFELPNLAAPFIDIEALPSKKRSEARKKLALLEAMFSGMADSVKAARRS
ncbi:DUF535 family protein [Roseateles koreensis]|uniref:DUF535 family protein n=1 Tax=Roseateles koreensis TaxID=2987526 RepID=A0ABT5KT01_9BURK|nr:DUF535 family protein [Roseateles koreensis]MDC8784986.1 DUF535 family protein [Roseateles koreensis]